MGLILNDNLSLLLKIDYTAKLKMIISLKQQ